MKKRNKYSQLKRLIEQKNSFLITSHIHLEPDALGSELAFSCLLAAFGKQAVIVNDGVTPGRYHFMPGVGKIRRTTTLPFEVAVILDCSDLNRIGVVRSLINDKIPIINIDHHISNTLFGNYNLVDKNASSACEIIYEIFKNLHVKLDKDIAFNLYCGIITDTGSFHYANTASKTLQIGANLVEFGLDINSIYRQVNKIDKLSHARLIGSLLSQAKSAFKGKLIYLFLPDEVGVGDAIVRDLADQALNILRLINKAEVFLLLRAIKNNKYVRLNLRSNGKVDVNRIAKVFNGGGHQRAASATIEGKLPIIKSRLFKEIGKFL
ncbi:MAG: bifunctional oligoribonuclease/PAP phosphatase NrnA [Candidatus Omnitrophota bacterium]